MTMGRREKLLRLANDPAATENERAVALAKADANALAVVPRKVLDIIKNGRLSEPKVMPEAVLKDGTVVSVQASGFHYSSPRDDKGPWSLVEVWFPGDEEPTGWVPVEQVEAFFEAHGGEA